MARVPRTSLPDGYFHVYSRSIASGALLFRDDDDRDTFLELIWRVARKHAWTCHAICLMGTHYHLVLETTRENLSAGLHLLNWRYAMYSNERHGVFGHVFAERFSARVIESDQYLFDACGYVLMNPVRAGLCDRIDDWPWSYSSYGPEAS